MADSIGEDEIAEVIGESGSIGSGRDRQSNPAISAQLQNFFRADANKKTVATERDPNSLISIFAKRNGVIPAEQTKERKLKKDRVRQSYTKHGKKTTTKILSTDSPIEEEEYPEDFSASEPKEDSSIMEDDNLKTSSGSASTKLRAVHSRRSSIGTGSKKRSNKNVKSESDSIAEELIEEEFPDDDKDDDSIKEESIANEIDSDDGKKRSSESMAEDSIIKEEYDGDNFASYNAS